MEEDQESVIGVRRLKLNLLRSVCVLVLWAGDDEGLRAEGAAMHHCVASYWRNVVNGKSRIYSIRENGSRVATLEVTGQLTQYKGRNDALTVLVRGNGQRSRYQVSQLVGARNSRPAPEVVKVVGTFVEEINTACASRPAGL
jgi:hypothetical protein